MAPLGAGGVGLDIEMVFPSGRAAIAQSLEALDLPANSAIALAGHGSECLTRIVRRYGTPLDLFSRHGTPLDLGNLQASAGAIVVYEPWGWPLTNEAWQQLTASTRGRALIIDRVDSADFCAPRLGHDLPPGTVEVLSLSKLLGLAGGGLARTNGALVKLNRQPESDGLRSLRHRSLATLDRGGYRELFKDSRQAVHPAALLWLQQNCLEHAAEVERRTRNRHLVTLMDSQLAAGWPTWMVRAIGAGIGPVWAPVLRGQDATTIWDAMRTLDQRCGVVSASRLFNWSGNPLRPEFETCLALPVHSGVTDVEELIAALA